MEVDQPVNVNVNDDDVKRPGDDQVVGSEANKVGSASCSNAFAAAEEAEVKGDVVENRDDQK